MTDVEVCSLWQSIEIDCGRDKETEVIKSIATFNLAIEIKLPSSWSLPHLPVSTRKTHKKRIENVFLVVTGRWEWKIIWALHSHYFLLVAPTDTLFIPGISPSGDQRSIPGVKVCMGARQKEVRVRKRP